MVRHHRLFEDFMLLSKCQLEELGVEGILQVVEAIDGRGHSQNGAQRHQTDVIGKERSNLEAMFTGWTCSTQGSNLSFDLHCL